MDREGRGGWGRMERVVIKRREYSRDQRVRARKGTEGTEIWIGKGGRVGEDGEGDDQEKEEKETFSGSESESEKGDRR